MDGRPAGGGAGIGQLNLFCSVPPAPVPPARRPGHLSHVLLDLDGCLIDSREPILRSLNAALRSVGLSTITAVELEPLIGPPLQESVATVLSGREADLALIGPVVTAFRERYRSLAVELTTAVSGVDAVVADLAERFTLAVVTTKPTVFAEPILAALGLRDRFAAVFGTSLEDPEPKRVTLGRALRELEVVAPATVMVGDRHHDVAAAHAHGVVAIGVTWGHGTAGELRAAGARHVVDRPEELGATIDRLA